jgi:hypothetical protein
VPKGKSSGWIEGTLRRSLSQGRMTWDAFRRSQVTVGEKRARRAWKQARERSVVNPIAAVLPAYKAPYWQQPRERRDRHLVTGANLRFIRSSCGRELRD